MDGNNLLSLIMTVVLSTPQGLLGWDSIHLVVGKYRVCVWGSGSEGVGEAVGGRMGIPYAPIITQG